MSQATQPPSQDKWHSASTGPTAGTRKVPSLVAGLLATLKPEVPSKSTIISLQALRFFAAFLVLLAHLSSYLQKTGEKFGVTVVVLPEEIGNFGVEVFFVISGFIMAHVAWNSFGSAAGSWTFFKKRILRVAPLYWLLTLAQAGIIVISPKETVAVPELVKSLFFIPYLNELGKHRPVLGQGWTLDFEMFFYVLFAIGLLASRRVGLTVIFALLTGAVGYKLVFGQAPILFDHILIFFVVGLVLGVARRSFPSFQFKLPGLLFVVCGILVGAVAVNQVWLYAAAAALSVGLCVFARDVNRLTPASRLLAALGDASYSLYLSHTFVLLFTTVAWRKLFGGHYLPLYILVSVVGSIAGSWLCYRWAERICGAVASRILFSGETKA